MDESEIWITDIAELVADGDCVRIDLVSGKKHIVLRGSLHTLVKTLELGKRAVQQQISADVVALPKHG